MNLWRLASLELGRSGDTRLKHVDNFLEERGVKGLYCSSDRGCYNYDKKMIEHATWGVVLDRTRDDELDTEYSIFTWDLGKVKAKATSVRKITSKLAGHLEPGSLIRLRLVQKAVDGNFKIVESLVEERTKDQAAVKAMLFVDQMTGLLQADIYLFAFLKGLAANEVTGGEVGRPAGEPRREVGYYRRILTLLGFDPENATCSVCNEAKIAYFIPQDIMFLCHQCLQKVKQSSDRSGISLRSS